MIADVAIFITLCSYSTILLSVFIILCIRSLWIITTWYKFVPLNTITLIPHPPPHVLVTTILLFFISFNILRFRI